MASKAIHMMKIAIPKYLEYFYVSLEWTWKVYYLKRNLKGIARGNSTKKLIHIIQEKQRGT